MVEPCDGTVGDTATLNVTAYLKLNSSARYDIGVWFGEVPACTVSDIPVGSFSDGDTCGDTNASGTSVSIGTITIACVDTDRRW